MIAVVGQADGFDRHWIVIAVLLILLGFLLRAPALSVLSALILTLFPVAQWWSRRALHHVTYRRRLSQKRAFPGETLELTVEITNRKLLPVPWLRIRDDFPRAVGPMQAGTTLLAPSHEPERGFLVSALALRWYEQVQRCYTLHCERRGIYSLGPVHYQGGDLFSLFQSERSEPAAQHVIVYPRVLPLRDLGIPARAPFGDTRSSRPLFQDPSRIMGCRDHHPYDSFRHIHWKATARQSDLMVKVYEPMVSLNIVVCLNIATFAHPWEGVQPELLEHAIIVAGSIASHALEHGDVVGLIANGAMPHADQPLKVLPGRAPDQLGRILEVLAGVTPFATGSIERLLRDESPDLPWGATLVVVTAVVTPELRATLVRLREAGRRLVLIGVSSTAPEPPPGVLCYHVPPVRSGRHIGPEPVDFRSPEKAAHPNDRPAGISRAAHTGAPAFTREDGR
jgi:uncharacterized protein (DUF58 family)